MKKTENFFTERRHDERQAKKEEKKRKKIRTGGFVDEIYEDDLEEEAPVQKTDSSGKKHADCNQRGT